MRILLVAALLLCGSVHAAEFALLDADNVVVKVIVAESSFIATQPGVWKESRRDGVAVYKNPANVGSIFDAERQAFITPRRYPSWVLNERTCQWEAPTPYPTDGKFYRWDEPTVSWKLVP